VPLLVPKNPTLPVNPTLTQPFVTDVRAFGSIIRLATNCLEGRNVLSGYAFPTLPRSEVSEEEADRRIGLDRVGDHFQLSMHDSGRSGDAGTVVASACEAISLVPNLIHLLDEGVVQHLTNLRAVHAGTLFLGGRALLLPGATHTGKSSLVAELVRQGATYFSDEYALIDAEGRAHPYPRPLLLRNGNSEQAPTLPEELNAKVGSEPAPVGWVLSLEYQAGRTWCIQPVPQSLALMDLLRNTPHTLADSPQIVTWFQNAVASALCFAGWRGDAADAANRILDLASRPS
jgi:hypothetical protein